jgi:hypothetical protein
MPLEKVAPKSTPTPAMIIITLNEAAFDPIAELRKFTASLLTPTTKSEIAKMKRTITSAK